MEWPFGCGRERFKETALYNDAMAKNVIYISEAEAANDFRALVGRVRAGAEVIIERDSRPAAVWRGF